MIEARPIGDPTLLALPKTSKPFTGSRDVAEDLVVRVMNGAHQFAINAREQMPPEENLAGLRATVDSVVGILAGKNDDYETLAWHANGGLAQHLRERYGMTGTDDPVAGILTRLALNVVQLYKAWQADEVDDGTAEVQLGALKIEAVRDMLGLPDERGSDG